MALRRLQKSGLAGIFQFQTGESRPIDIPGVKESSMRDGDISYALAVL
jgi:hypothetical protein